MDSQACWPIEFGTTGEAPQTTAAPDRSCQVLIGNFDVSSSRPLRGGTPIASYVEELERDAGMASRLARARQQLGAELGGNITFRRLRLMAGLSQARLAQLASTTQTYVARLEAGSIDPGTDMLARLATALAVQPVALFNAVRAQRTDRT